MLFLPQRLASWAKHCQAAELCYAVPQALMLAILDRESLGGDALHPKGPTGKGDKGNAHGLAQIDARFHHRFLAATFDDNTTPLWTDPAFNILYGARLLAHNFAATNSWPIAVAAYNCGLTRATRAAQLAADTSEPAVILAVDKATTGGDYVSDVWRRRHSFFGDEAHE